jgi:hypothetical protein
MALQYFADISAMSAGLAHDLANAGCTLAATTAQALIGEVPQQAAPRRAAPSSLRINRPQQLVWE